MSLTTSEFTYSSINCTELNEVIFKKIFPKELKKKANTLYGRLRPCAIKIINHLNCRGVHFFSFYINFLLFIFNKTL